MGSNASTPVGYHGDIVRPRHHRAWIACAIALGLGLGPGGTVLADEGPVVVVVESGQSVPTRELVTGLNVHLGGSARVEGGANLSGTTADRFNHASLIVKSGEAVLVVWIDRTANSDDSRDDYIVYAVGRDPSRALVEVVRIPADDRASTVRIMALKVANLVDEVLSASDPSRQVTQTFADTAVARASAATYGALFELGASGRAVGGDVGAQAGLGFNAGLERAAPGVDVSAHLGARWMTGLRADNEQGELKIDEIDLGLELRITKRWHRRGMGVNARIAARLLDADAQTVDGRTDSAFAMVPLVGVGLHGETPLPWQLRLHIHVGAETAMYRQRFQILHRPVADLGRFQLVSGIFLGWGWR